MHHTDKQKEDFLNILKKKNYHVSKSCIAFGIDRGTYYKWLQEDWFKERIEWMKEEDVDDSEETLRILRKGVPKKNKQGEIVGWLIKPDVTATIFHLKTKGKERGYVERTETVDRTKSFYEDLSDEDLKKMIKEEEDKLNGNN